LKKVIENNYPTIGDWEKSITPKDAEKLTTVMIADLSSSFNDDLTADAIDELTVEIHSSIYRNLSYEDLFLVTKNLKQSEVKFKLNINKVLRALEKHHVTKCDKIYESNLNNHLANKVDNSERGMSQEAAIAHHRKRMNVFAKQNDLNATKELIKNAKPK
jgi:hypothetical protein